MKNWNLLRIKDVCKINPYTAFADSKIPFAPMSAIGTDGRLVIQEWKLNSDITKYSSARNGDVLFAKVTPCFENGKGCIVELSDPLLATTEVTVLRPFENIISAKYLSLITKSPDFLAYGKTNMKGANGLKRVTEKATAQYTFLVPNKSEQHAIAQFLDDRTSAIDSKISALEEKEQSLAELRKSIIHEAVTKGLDPKVPMKASGVDWIGDIPAHWEVKRVKDLCYPSISKTTSIPTFYVGMEHVESGTGIFNPVLLNDYAASTYNVLEKGTFGFGKLRPYLAKLFQANTLVAASTEFLLFKLDSNSNPGYVKYYLLNNTFITHLNDLVSGAKMPRVSWPDFSNQSILIQPPAEQQAIASYLDERTSVIDQSIDTVKKEIEALQELRKSLIHEAVTGKLDVADFGYNY